MSSETIILIPGPESGWEIWNARGSRSKLLRTVDGPDQWPRKRGGVRVGIPASHVTTFSFRVPTTDAALFPDLAFSQLERRGLAPGGTAVHATHVIERGAEESLLAVDVLSRAFPADLCLTEAVDYAPSVRFFPLPENRLVLLREQGRFILAAGRRGQMTFSQILNTGGGLDAAAAQEINLALLSLQGSDQMGEGAELEVWMGEPDSPDFAKALHMSCSFGDQPPPDADRNHGASGPMFPPEVQEEKERLRQRQKLRTGLLALAAVYVVIAVGLALFFQHQRTRAARLEKEVAAYRPEVEFIKQAMARSSELEPAYEKRFYPMRQLNEVARTMPPSGVVIHKFSTQGRNLRLEGLARDPQLAYQLVEDLGKHPEFPGYTWEMNPPSVNQNNSASLRIDGRYAIAD